MIANSSFPLVHVSGSGGAAIAPPTALLEEPPVNPGFDILVQSFYFMI